MLSCISRTLDTAKFFSRSDNLFYFIWTCINNPSGIFQHLHTGLGQIEVKTCYLVITTKHRLSNARNGHIRTAGPLRGIIFHRNKRTICPHKTK